MTSPNPLPVHLITGLLGSGKTTTLKQLIKQKPAHEVWGFIINEFGEVDIDAATLSQADPDNSVLSVAGGCVCCTAQYGLTQAINQLLNQQSEQLSGQTFTRIWIEPTGLGHPAKIIDTLTRSTFVQPLSLQKIVCVITPQQLTKERWDKSAVMRDLVTLANMILLNKIDRSSKPEVEQAMQLLNDLYPPKQAVFKTEQSQIELKYLLSPRASQALTLLSTKGQVTHSQQLKSTSECVKSSLPGISHCIKQLEPSSDRIKSIGWVFNNQIQFSRTQLKAFFASYGHELSRAKGILKTGNEWQLINWTNHKGQTELTFEDIAWRQDSRLECIFSVDQKMAPNDLGVHKVIEIQLLSCIAKTT